MTRLSKTQIEVLEGAKRAIDFARTHTFEEWFEETTHHTIESQKNYNPEDFDEIIADFQKTYEERKNGFVYTYCSGATLQKLQNCGLIEIVKDTTNTKRSHDTVKVLNY